MMIIIGTICSCSKDLAHSPMMKPRRLKPTEDSTRNATIQTGCRICTPTKTKLVTRITSAIMIDLTAAAPTKPIVTSIQPTGDTRYSKIVPLNFGK